MIAGLLIADLHPLLQGALLYVLGVYLAARWFIHITDRLFKDDIESFEDAFGLDD
jgi:hypothetical protein